MTRQRYILDTNIVSETLKQSPDSNVIAWLLLNEDDIWLNAVTVGELLTGAYRLPTGRRREGLLLAIDSIVNSYPGQIAAYDSQATISYASLQDASRRSGRQLTVEDGMIAAICQSRGCTLATRNTKDFEHLGIPIINPFEAPASDL
jgi:predicted nucleic acid-binding protein